MKYYYGNDWVEAVNNPPVEIKTTKQLRQYEECYNIVVSVDDVKEEEEEYDE